jgi:hypothetical protein
VEAGVTSRAPAPWRAQRQITPRERSRSRFVQRGVVKESIEVAAKDRHGVPSLYCFVSSKI